MSVTRLYHCDLCRGATGGLIGIYWKAAGVSPNPDFLTLRPAKGEEHHLCRRCFTEIRLADEPPGDQWFQS